MAPQATVDLNGAHGFSQIMHFFSPSLLCHTLQLLAKNFKRIQKEEKMNDLNAI